ncbi:MAG TPA: carbonic anhydrase [bacterium]
MKKLINGILQFRRSLTPERRQNYARLALGQSPDALLITCSDSRVAPNVFASTDPGDLFVVRNVGNLIAPWSENDHSGANSVAAAAEYAVAVLKVPDIVVCGHAECGAMRAIVDGRDRLTAPFVKDWLAHGEPSLRKMRLGQHVNPDLPPHNTLSQLNVLQQMEHLASYPIIQERLEAGKLRVHGWWFDIGQADLYAYEPSQHRFMLIDEEEARRLLKLIGSAP